MKSAPTQTIYYLQSFIFNDFHLEFYLLIKNSSIYSFIKRITSVRVRVCPKADVWCPPQASGRYRSPQSYTDEQPVS